MATTLECVCLELLGNCKENNRLNNRSLYSIEKLPLSSKEWNEIETNKCYRNWTKVNFKTPERF